jgi:hypothetical protein
MATAPIKGSHATLLVHDYERDTGNFAREVVAAPLDEPCRTDKHRFPSPDSIDFSLVPRLVVVMTRREKSFHDC